MIFDSSKLKGLIREKGLTQEIVAKKIGIAYSTFNLKLNRTLYFTQEEIFNISNVLEIPKTEIYEYFFTTKVKKTKQNNHEPIHTKRR